jgi:glycosyltransferase involved in cell wall biosynthesis
LVIEVDDAHHLLPFKAAKLGAWFAGAQRVIVGNEVLAQAVRARGGMPVVVPTVIEIGRFDPAHTAPQEDLSAGEPLRLVWVGLGANIGQLLSVRPALETGIASGMIRLSVVTSPGADLDGLDATLIPWSEASEAAALSAAHVGIMPLPQTPWAAGKCSLKLLQYQAAGLACVASPVGMNRLFEGRGSVILAADPGAWLQAFSTLRDGAERRRLAGRGRALVASQYSVAIWAPRLAAIYRAVAAAP